MASYASFKKIYSDQIPNGTINDQKLASGVGLSYGVLWIYNERGLQCHQCANAGSCIAQANGRCCQWTVPTNVTKATFEIWSGGGGGAGSTCCACYSTSIGGAGGNYASKTISVTPGSTYTICAGGSWPCAASHTCTAGMGCKSFVTGTGLSNFCANGGCGGWMCNTSSASPGPPIINSGCENCSICCGCGFSGADFGIMGTVGGKNGQSFCSCYGITSYTGVAPFIGLWHSTQASNAWCSCGCYVNWPAGGGASGVSPYCGNNAKCCAAGAQGGSGIVRVTYY